MLDDRRTSEDAAAADHLDDLRIGVELAAKIGSRERRDRLVFRERVRDAAETVRAVAVDAAVANVERGARDLVALALWHRRRLCVGHAWKTRADVCDELAHLALGDNGAPDRHVRLLRVRRLPEPVVDDAAQLGDGQLLARARQRRHVRRDVSVTALAVALGASKLDEHVGPRRDGRIDGLRGRNRRRRADGDRVLRVVASSPPDEPRDRDQQNHDGGDYRGKLAPSHRPLPIILPRAVGDKDVSRSRHTPAGAGTPRVRISTVAPRLLAWWRRAGSADALHRATGLAAPARVPWLRRPGPRGSPGRWSARAAASPARRSL